jgi:hypothetical protein
MNTGAVIITPIFLCLGIFVVSTYVICGLLITYYPVQYDAKGLWAGLHNKNGPIRWRMVAWCIGEILACVGFLFLTHMLIWNVDSSQITMSMIFFYVLFLITAMFWMPLTIQGDRFYSLTIFFLFLTAIATCGLFVESILLWSYDNYKPWMVLPLALHCTFFDFVFWSLTWNPTSYLIISQKSVDDGVHSPFFICDNDDLSDDPYKPINRDEIEYDIQMIIKKPEII